LGKPDGQAKWRDRKQEIAVCGSVPQVASFKPEDRANRHLAEIGTTQTLSRVMTHGVTTYVFIVSKTSDPTK
jgi:hypothetical protein